jgi:hypothetical protein
MTQNAYISYTNQQNALQHLEQIYCKWKTNSKIDPAFFVVDGIGSAHYIVLFILVFLLCMWMTEALIVLAIMGWGWSHI